MAALLLEPPVGEELGALEPEAVGRAEELLFAAEPDPEAEAEAEACWVAEGLYDVVEKLHERRRSLTSGSFVSLVS